MVSDNLIIEDYDLDNPIILCNIAQYYELIKKDYELMKKYYLLSIDNSDTLAMYSLGSYYEDNDKYDEMKKYYLLAIDKGNPNSMYNLGSYYKKYRKRL